MGIKVNMQKNICEHEWRRNKGNKVPTQHQYEKALWQTVVKVHVGMCPNTFIRK